MEELTIRPVGVVHRDDEEFPEGECVLEVRPELKPALLGLEPGMRVLVMWWMHRLEEEKRHILQGHPFGDESRPIRGAFALRSPKRPNPIGSSVVEIVDVRDNELVVRDLDAFDGSPVVDIKIAIAQDE